MSVHALLEGFVVGVESFGAIVEVEAMGAGRGECAAEPVYDGGAADAPMGGEASGGGEEVRVFGECVEGGEPAHARSHNKGVVAVGQGAEGVVYEGLEFFDDKAQVAVGVRGDAVFADECPIERGVLGEAEGFFWHIIGATLNAIPDSDDDDPGVIGALHKPGHRLDHAPVHTHA